MKAEILEFYRTHRAEIEALADTRTLFFIDFVRRYSSITLRRLEDELGWGFGDLILIAAKLSEAGIIDQVSDANTSVTLTQKGMDLHQLLWSALLLPPSNS